MLRLAYVVPGPTFGGPANTMARIAEPLRRRGYDPVAVLSTEPGNATERSQALGATVVNVPMHRARATSDPRAHLRWAAHLPADLRAMRRVLRELDAGIVLPHGDLNPQAGLVAHALGIPVAWMLIDTRTPMALRKVTMPVVTRAADVVMTVGADLGNQYPGVAALGDRHLTVYPAVDTDAFTPSPQRRAAARAELEIPDGALAVGVVGNLNAQKGQDHLARAVAEARRRSERIVLRVLGASTPGHEEHEQAVRAAAAQSGLDEEAFRIVDPGARVPELMPGLDVMVVSSVPRSEGVPTVLLEAMACGVAVVSTDVGAVREIVHDEQTGLVVAPLDDTAMAGALLRLDDEAARQELADAGRAMVLREHGLEACADRHAAGFDRAVRHRATRRRRRGRR